MIIVKDSTKTHFVGADLEIYSKSDLQSLVSAFGEKVFVLHVGRVRGSYFAGLSVTKRIKDADAAIRVFCDLIRALPRSARKLWNEAKTRNFNIGVQAQDEPRSYEMTLAADTVKEVAKLGARIVFTLYSPELDRPPQT